MLSSSKLAYPGSPPSAKSAPASPPAYETRPIVRAVTIIDGRAYFVTALNCLKTPHIPATYKDHKADKRTQWLTSERTVKRLVRLPFVLTPGNLSITFEDFEEGNIAYVSNAFLSKAITGLVQKARATTKPDSLGISVDEESITLDYQNGAEFQPIGEAALKAALTTHRRRRSLTPDWRAQDVILCGDSAIGRETDDFVTTKSEPKDGKSSKSSKSEIGPGAKAPPPESPWSSACTFQLGPRSIKGPTLLDPAFFRHIANEDGASGEMGTGHVRVSHDTNAFPRTWSLEKIGRVAATALNIASTHQDQIDAAASEKHFPFRARVEGLNIVAVVRQDAFVTLKNGEPGWKSDKKKVFSAYVSRTTSAREAEIRDIRQAVKKMNRLTSAKAVEIVSLINPKSVWSVLSTANALWKSRGTLGLNEQGRQILEEVRALLSIGETRHKIHQQLIDEGTAAILQETNQAGETVASPLKSVVATAQATSHSPAASVDGKKGGGASMTAGK